MTENVKIVGLAEFYAEVHHTRGNFTKFEFMGWDDDEDAGITDVDVWENRRMSEEDWAETFKDNEVLRLIDGAEGTSKFRITRYPDLEKDILDVPYHPSVESWKIDPNKVKEHFNGNH